MKIRMRTISTAVASAAVLVSGLAGPMDVARADAKSCFPRGSHTIEGSRDVRVYWRGHIEDQRTYACLYRGGRTRYLGRFQSDTGIANEVVSGRFVGYQNLVCEEDCRNSEVRILDVKTGSLRRSSKAGEGTSGISGFVLKRNGSAAWIRRFGGDEAAVHTLTATGESVIDTGVIAPASLALSGSHLYWTKNGAAMSALLN
jgi:hypothetical protein